MPGTEPQDVQDALRRALDGSLRPERALESVLVPELPARALWLLVALANHEPRQAWVASVVTERLGGDLQAIGTRGYAGHPTKNARAGEVPGLPGWRYDFHGCGCCLTNDGEGAFLDVDFGRDGSWKQIDLLFYSDFLRWLPRRVLPERRLAFAPELRNAWQADLAPLEERELFRQPRPGNRITLTDGARALVGRVRPIVERLVELERQGFPAAGADEGAVLAASLNDEELALELAERGTRWSDSIVRLRQVQADRRTSRAMELARIVELDDHARRSGEALEALAVLGRDVLDPVLLRLLEASPSRGVSHTAFRLVEETKDRLFAPALARLLEDEEPGKGDPFTTFAICRALLAVVPVGALTERERSRLADHLEPLRQGIELPSEAGLLLGVLDERRAARVLARELHRPEIQARGAAGAALVILGTPLARRLLEITIERAPKELLFEARDAHALLTGGPRPPEVEGVPCQPVDAYVRHHRHGCRWITHWFGESAP